MERVVLKIDDVRLPVVSPSWKFSEPHNNIEEQIVGFGGITLKGKRKLRRFTYSSFYPRVYDAQYCQITNLMNTNKFIQKMLNYKNNKKSVYLMFSKYKPVNGNYLVDDFEFNTEDGTGDVYYNLSLLEYRLPTIPQTSYVYEEYNLGYYKETKTTVGRVYVTTGGETIVTIARKFGIQNTQDIYDDNKQYTVNQLQQNPLPSGMRLWIRGTE